MTKVLVKKWFSSYTGESIQLYYAAPRSTPMLIIKRADGSHRTERVVDVIDIQPPAAPVVQVPPVQFEHGE